MKMSTITTVFAAILIALGIFGCVAYGAPTSLIASGLGAMLLVCGWMARKDEWRMHAMHGAALVGVLGFLGGVMDWMKLPALWAGQEVAKPHAVALKSIMALLCLIFLVLCIKSFIDARIARRQG